jgi:signal transduction histidine kinase
LDTRLRNKHLYVLMFILSIFLLTLSMFTALDLMRNKFYIRKDPYFRSLSFKNDLRNYFEKVSLVIESYKDSTVDSDSQWYTAEDLRLIESNLSLSKSLKYYIVDINIGKTYTNLINVPDVDEFIREKSLYVESFPRGHIRHDYLGNINNWFLQHNYEGKFIFVEHTEGFSQMHEDYRYFNAIRKRIVKELIIGSLSLISAFIILMYLFLKRKPQLNSVENIRHLYEKIPLDLRILIFIIYSFIVMVFTRGNFFYTPIGTTHIIKFAFASVFVFYLFINIYITLRMMIYKEELISQLKGSLLYTVTYLLIESFKVSGVMMKAGFVFVLTTLFGMFIIRALLALVRNETFIFFLSCLYIFIYLLILPIFALKRIVSINRIIQGTDEITGGNLNYLIDGVYDENLSKLAMNINNMKNSVKRSVESQVKSERLKTELITNVSHDLRTPLTSIINYIDLLKKGGLSAEEISNYIEVLEGKSQRLKVLIEDLFEASKISSGAVELNIEKVDIVSLLRQSLGEYDEKISSSSLSFKLNIPAHEVLLELDGRRTWRVFENLISNAVKYSQPNTRVYIDLKEESDKVFVVMKNVSSYEMDFDVEEIFDRFKRGDKERSTEGSGLGLAIAKSIVELQGGNMYIAIDGDLFKVTVEFKKGI